MVSTCIPKYEYYSIILYLRISYLPICLIRGLSILCCYQNSNLFYILYYLLSQLNKMNSFECFLFPNVTLYDFKYIVILPEFVPKVEPFAGFYVITFISSINSSLIYIYFFCSDISILMYESVRCLYFLSLM